MHRPRLIFLALLALASAATVLPAEVAGATSTSQIGLRVQGTPTVGLTPVVTVQVGSSVPLKVILDTGSVGLHVYANRLPQGASSGIALSTQEFSEPFVSGETY